MSNATQTTFAVKIGSNAAVILCLDDPYGSPVAGITVSDCKRRVITVTGCELALVELAKELTERADVSGEGWDLQPAERTACRRAARSIYAQLDLELPWHLRKHLRKHKRRSV